MAGSNSRVLIELYVDDQGTVKIREATAAVRELGAAGKQGFADSAASADDFAGALAKQLGIYALITAAAYKLEQGIVGAFKAGIGAVDNYKIAVIAIAASLTDLAKPGQGDMSELFQRNVASAEGMYRAINVEAAKHFAGAHEMMMVYNRLVQSGYNVRLEEVGALGTLADKIKIATQGQNQEVQLNQEIRALMEGQARAYSLLAMELQTRLGPEWSTLLEKHKAAGTLLQWLTSLWPGLQVATGRVTETITSQYTTMKSLAELLAIDSLGGAYQDLVGYMKQINQYLRENHQFLSSDIVQAWDTVKIAVGGVTEAVKILIAEINMISLGALEKLPGMIQGASLYLKDMKKESWIGERTQSRYEGMMKDEQPAGIWTATQGMLGHAGANQALARSRQLMEAARATAEQEWAGQNPYYDILPGLATAGRFPNKPVELVNRAKGEDAGKGAEGAENSMRTLMDRLQQDISRLSEGGVAAVEAWYNKTMNDIAKLVAKGADGTEAEALAWKAGSLKKTKIVEDFWLMVDKQTGEGFQSIDDQYQKDLVKYGEIKGAKAALLDIWSKKTYDLEQKYAGDIENLQKSSLSTLASNAPLLSDQLGFQRQIMEVEIRRQQIALDRKIADDHIPEAQANELRGLLALADASRRYAQERKEWETQGIGGGLNIYATERQVEMQKRGALETVQMLKSAESWLGDTFGNAAYNTMRGQKQQFQKLWQDIMSNAVTWAFKQSAKMLGDTLGHYLHSGQGSAQGSGQGGNIGGYRGGSGGYGGGLGGGYGGGTPESDSVTAQWQTIGDRFDRGIGQFDTSTQTYQTSSNQMGVAGIASIGAAAGMGLAAIGVLTGSQTLTTVGTVFMMAAQLLVMAAMISMAKWWHSGGIVAHSGMIIAHGGLSLDERPAILQVGEWVLNRNATAQLSRFPGAFDMLNSGRLPALPLPVPGNFSTPGRQAVQHTTNITIVSPDGRVLGKHQIQQVMDETQKRITHREIRIPK